MVDMIEYSIYLGLYGNLDFNTQVEQPPLTYKEYSEVEDRKALLSSIKNRITMGCVINEQETVHIFQKELVFQSMACM